MKRGTLPFFALFLIVLVLVAVRGIAEESKPAGRTIDPYFVGSWKSRLYHVTAFTRFENTGKYESTVFLEGKPAAHSIGTWYVKDGVLWEEEIKKRYEPNVSSTLRDYPRGSLIILDRDQDSFSAKISSGEIVPYKRIPD